MPSSLTFDGRTTRVPGAVSKVDASALESVGLGASGVIAILGTAEGGVPVTALSDPEDFPRFSSSEKMIAAYRSGQLLEVADMVFAPGKDDAIPAGAQQVVAMKVNPATQSTGSLLRSGLPVIDLTSRDYGAFTSQINVEVATGTNKGKALTISFEDITETVDDLGGDALFTVDYVPGTYGYDTITGAVNDAGAFTATATRAAVGKSADLTTDAANAAVEVAEASITTATTNITTKVSNTMTATGFTGGAVTAAMVGKLVVITGAASSGNNGTFPITARLSGSSFEYTNAAGVATDANNGAITMVIKDTPVTITVYGLVSGVPTTETLVTSGDSTTTGTVIWDASGVMGATVDAAPAVGALTLKSAPGGVTIFTFAVGTVAMGALICENCFVATGNALSLALSGSGTPTILIFGKDNASATVKEAVALTGAVPVLTTHTNWAQIDVIAMAYVSNTRTLTATVTAAKTTAAAQGTLAQLKTYLDARQNIVGPTTYGFVFAYGTGATSASMSGVDILSGVDIHNVAGEFTADLTAEVDWINSHSQLVSAVVHAGAAGVPDNTSAPMYLTGGVEGTALVSHYQTALNLLKRVRVNSVVDLSGDPAVAALLDAHCAYMGGAGKSERDGFVGILNGAKTDVPTKAELRTQILDLNSRHIRATVQAVTRFNRAGDKTEFLPPFLAAIAAGMQAGSPVGTSLTHKFINALKVRQDSSWNPTDDANELIGDGAWIVENVDGQGRRNVRDSTTHLSSDNLAFTEGSVNNAVNQATFNFRTRMELIVGATGSMTIPAATGEAVGVLNAMVKAEEITAWRSLQMTRVLEKLQVSVEMSPEIPVLFIPITIHLTNPAQTAAANPTP